MSQVVSQFIKDSFNCNGRGNKVAAMPLNEVQEYMATHLSREFLEEREKEKENGKR